MNNPINIFDEFDLKQGIVNALQLSTENIMPEIMVDNNLLERNGYGQFRWNVIISQLRGMCYHLGWIELSICPRGGWKTPVLYHPKTGLIITLMTEDTFKTVQKRTDKGKHYLCGGASFNQGLEPQYEQIELELPGVPVDLDPWVVQSREQLARAVKASAEEIKGHVLVLFDTYADKLLSVRAVRLTPSLEISTAEEDWSELIGKGFDAYGIVEPLQNAEDEYEELVELI